MKSHVKRGTYIVLINSKSWGYVGIWVSQMRDKLAISQTTMQRREVLTRAKVMRYDWVSDNLCSPTNYWSTLVIPLFNKLKSFNLYFENDLFEQVCVPCAHSLVTVFKISFVLLSFINFSKSSSVLNSTALPRHQALTDSSRIDCLLTFQRGHVLGLLWLWISLFHHISCCGKGFNPNFLIIAGKDSWYCPTMSSELAEKHGQRPQTAC